MTTRIQRILTDARYKLGDVSAERWADARLLRLVNAAQLDIAKQTKILKRSFRIVLQEGQYLYELPEDVWLILRATFDSNPIALKTYDEMDDFAEAAGVNQLGRTPSASYANANGLAGSRFKWDTDTGADVQALIYDNRDMSTIRVYPIPEGIEDTSYTFDKVVVEFVGDELTGVVVDMDDYTFNSPYGVIVGMYDPAIEEELMSAVYGVTSGIGETSKYIQVWCVKKPAELETLFDIPEVPSLYDEAMMHYVVSHAFDDDTDTRSLEKSSKALAHYERELKIPAATSRRDGVMSPKAAQSTYRGPFNA